MPKAAPAVCIDWADALNHSEALAAWLRSQARVAIVAGDDAKAHELVEAADRLGLQGNLLVLFGPRCHGGAR